MTRAIAWRAAALGAALLLVWPTAVPALAQDQAAQPQVAADAMQQMAFLVGQWQGDGWIDVAPGRRVAFIETETVTPKLDGLALLIEGRGTQPPPSDALVVHEALAVLTYDADLKRYAFRAYQGGRGTTSAVDADASLVDGALVWSFKPNPEGALSIRYTISVSPAGEWLEVGEVAADGQTWQPFFEMTLTRQAPLAESDSG